MSCSTQCLQGCEEFRNGSARDCFSLSGEDRQHEHENGGLAALFVRRCDRRNRHDERECILNERHRGGLVIALQSRIEVRPGVHSRDREVNRGATQECAEAGAEGNRSCRMFGNGW